MLLRLVVVLTKDHGYPQVVQIASGFSAGLPCGFSDSTNLLLGDPGHQEGLVVPPCNGLPGWTTWEKSPNPSVGLKSPGSHPAS